MIVNFSSIWNWIVWFCAGWNIFIVLLSFGVNIGQIGTIQKEKVNDANSAFLLVGIFGIPAFITGGRIFGWW